MIQTLRKKFVFTAMAAVTVLILFMLGAINIANIILVRSEMDRTLRMISENDGSPNKLLPPSAPPGFSIRMPENDYDTFLSSNFFNNLSNLTFSFLSSLSVKLSNCFLRH